MGIAPGSCGAEQAGEGRQMMKAKQDCCPRCGAYIPIGQTKCLACGRDSAVRHDYNHLLEPEDGVLDLMALLHHYPKLKIGEYIIEPAVIYPARLEKTTIQRQYCNGCNKERTYPCWCNGIGAEIRIQGKMDGGIE